MHRVIARTRGANVPELAAKSWVPAGKRQQVGPHVLFYQEFDTEGEARAVIMRSIMNRNWWKADEMKLEVMNFLYRDYYATEDVFVTYDNTEIVTKQHITYAAEEGNH